MSDRRPRRVHALCLVSRDPTWTLLRRAGGVPRRHKAEPWPFERAGP